MNLIHKGIPSSSRIGRSGQIADNRRGITANPYGCRIVWGKSTEPAVLVIVGRTCLSGTNDAGIQTKTTCGTSREDALHHVNHCVSCLRIINIRFIDVIFNNRISFGIQNLHDTGWIAEFSIIFQCSKTGCHLKRAASIGQTTDRCGIGIILFHNLAKMHIQKILKTYFWCQFFKKLPGNRIQ